MHNLKANFDKFLGQVKSAMADRLLPDGNFRRYPRRPKLPDSSIIALCLCAEAMGIDSENLFWHKLSAEHRADFPDLVDRSNLNRRRRNLAPYVCELNGRLASLMNEGEDVYIVDSMPLPVCSIARRHSSRVCRESFETAPDRGFSSLTRSYYWGYKLHLVCSAGGVFRSMQLTKASVSDLHYLAEVRGTLRGCTLLGDKGYVSAAYRTDLFHRCGIDLQVPQRANQRGRTVYPGIYKRFRKRIETLFSQLCDQFMIKRNYAKGYNGFCTRVLYKLAARTVLQFFNILNDRPVNHTKHALAF